MSETKFLTAEWRWLVMLNYEVDPGILAPFTPPGVELDSWQGRTFASLVGFMFLNTKVLGVGVPFHRNFEEVNLRFYVRRRDREAGWRRGVVFIKEIVPRFAIAAAAREIYGEKYVSMAMRHRVELEGDSLRNGSRVEYGWQVAGKWQRLGVQVSGSPALADAGSEAEFITEHYWGYAAFRGGSIEYRVDHPSWQVWQAGEASFEGDPGVLYGAQFSECLSRAPASAFLAGGSPVTVYQGRRIT
ncbi:MAG TPA: DUF2071 domain-containing protein [Anaerolineales bacterium]